MCGRFDSFLPPEFIAQLFSTVNTLPNLKPTWNMVPTKDAVHRHPDVGPDAVFHKGPEESAQPTTSEIFRAAFAKRRCLVPAAAYYGATIPMGSGPIDKAGQAKFPKVLNYGGWEFAMGGNLPFRLCPANDRIGPEADMQPRLIASLPEAFSA